MHSAACAALLLALALPGSAAVDGANEGATVHLRSLAIPSPAGADTVRLAVDGEQLQNVSELTLTLRADPPDAFDFDASTFVPYPGFTTRGVTGDPSDGTFYSVGKSTTFALNGARRLGVFTLVPGPGFELASWTVELQYASIGSGPYKRDMAGIAEPRAMRFGAANSGARLALSPALVPAPAAGQAVALDVVGSAMAEVVQADVFLEVTPVDAFDYGASDYVAASGLAVLSLERLADGLLVGAGAVTDGALPDSGVIGTFHLMPGPAFEPTATSVRLRAVSLGPDSHVRDIIVPDSSAALTTFRARIVGDFNADDHVDFADFFLFADAFGGSDPVYDLDGGGTVDFTDFFLFADSFGL